VRPDSSDFWSTPFDGGSNEMVVVDLQAQMINHLGVAAVGRNSEKPFALSFGELDASVEYARSLEMPRYRKKTGKRL
jgi:hypothetical protein